LRLRGAPGVAVNNSPGDSIRFGYEGETMAGILWTIIVVLFILWLLGFLLHFGGGLINLILVIVVILVVYNLLTGRKAL
jgi:hypothetical protein